MPWRLLGATALAGLLVGGVIGWRVRGKPPEPKVEVREVERVKVEFRDRVVEKEVAGPVRVEEHWRTVSAPAAVVPGCPACPACEEHTRVEYRDRVVTETRTVASGAAQDTHKDSQVVTPPPPTPMPTWALSGGLQLVPDRRLELGLELRLFGPVWTRAWVLQEITWTLPAAGVGLRVEW